MRKFEWDDNKNKLNITKHSVDFVDAIGIFDNQMFVWQDTRKEYAEKRYIGMGCINERAMIVIYAERPPNIIRLISCRRANRREQKKFKTALKNRLETN